MTKSTRRLLAAGGLVMAVVGFLLFRPDTLFTEVPVDQSLEEAFTTAADAVNTTTPPPTTATPGTAAPTTSHSESEPVVVATGEFTGIDHDVRGSVTIYEQDDRFILRFEDDTDIQNGPDLYVWVLESYDGGIPGDYLDLGVLTGTVGSQNYQLPPDFDPSVHRTVLIWCLRFAVPFAAARLQ